LGGCLAAQLQGGHAAGRRAAHGVRQAVGVVPFGRDAVQTAGKAQPSGECVGAQPSGECVGALKTGGRHGAATRLGTRLPMPARKAVATAWSAWRRACSTALGMSSPWASMAAA